MLGVGICDRVCTAALIGRRIPQLGVGDANANSLDGWSVLLLHVGVCDRLYPCMR